MSYLTFPHAFIIELSLLCRQLCDFMFLSYSTTLIFQFVNKTWWQLYEWEELRGPFDQTALQSCFDSNDPTFVMQVIMSKNTLPLFGFTPYLRLRLLIWGVGVRGHLYSCMSMNQIVWEQLRCIASSLNSQF